MAMTAARRRRIRIDPVYVFSWFCLGFWLLFAIFPVAWSYLNSFKPPEQIFDLPPKLIFTPTLHNYAVVFGLQVGSEAEGISQTQEATGVVSELPRYFLNSLIAFILVAFVVYYFVVRPVNHLMDRFKQSPEEPTPT